MNCPNCGGDVGPDDPFCPHCGQNIRPKRGRRKIRFILMDVQDDRRFKHLASAAVITVVIVAVLSVLLVDDQVRTLSLEGGETASGPSDTALIVSETAYIEMGGALADGSMTAYLTNNGELCITLDSDLTSGFDTFTWTLRDEVSGTYQYITKELEDGVAKINWEYPTIGSYTVILLCSSSETDDTAVYVGYMTYYGDSHVQHSFVFDGATYTVYTDVTLEEYLSYRDSDADRDASSPEDAATFIVTSDSVRTIASRLSDAYLRVNSTASTSDGEYARFILTFIQSCFTVTSDLSVYGQSTYWAYPAETLYLGTGDSGDLAVLAAAIFEASGYDAGIVLLHGHTVAAVSIADYAPTDAPDGYHLLSVTVDGVTYYLCETTALVQPGYVSTAYGYSGGRFLYYGEDTGEDLGFAKS